jgi:hypothetical protein
VLVVYEIPCPFFMSGIAIAFHHADSPYIVDAIIGRRVGASITKQRVLQWVLEQAVNIITYTTQYYDTSHHKATGSPVGARTGS